MTQSQTSTHDHPATPKKMGLTPRARDGKMRVMVLRCTCHNLPFAEIDFERAVLRIISRHRGQSCENAIPLLDLKEFVT
jgi:hypothetical protein